MEKQQTLIVEGKILDEIGGIPGLHKIISMVLQRFQEIYTSHKLVQMTPSKFSQKFLRNLQFAFSENEHRINIPRMLADHQKFDISFEDFFILKYVFWEVLNILQVNIYAILKFIQQIEKYRYKVIIVQKTQELYENQELATKIYERISWYISTSKLLYPLFEVDKKNEQEIIKQLAHCLADELIFRKLNQYKLEVFLRVLKVTEQQFDEINGFMVDTANYYEFDEFFQQDIHVKMQKVKVRMGFQKNIFRILGGVDGIESILLTMGDLFKTEEKLINFKKQFPEESNHIIYPPRDNVNAIQLMKMYQEHEYQAPTRHQQLLRQCSMQRNQFLMPN